MRMLRIGRDGRRHMLRDVLRNRRHLRPRRDVDELLDAVVETADQLGEAVWFVVTNLAAAAAAARGRLGGAAREMRDFAGQIVEAFVNAGELVGIVAVVVVLVPGRAAILRLLEDDVIEPFAERHAGAARGLARALAGLGPNAFHAPRDAKFHPHTYVRWST